MAVVRGQERGLETESEERLAEAWLVDRGERQREDKSEERCCWLLPLE